MRELRRSCKELAHLIKVPFADISDLNLNIVIAFDDPCSLTNKFKDKNLMIDAYRGSRYNHQGSDQLLHPYFRQHLLVGRCRLH